MQPPRKLQCCKCWRKGVPPTWLLICGVVLFEIGFGAYPVVVKKLAQQSSANPIIFTFYRDIISCPVLFICAFVAERKIMLPNLSAMLIFLLLGSLGMLGNQLLYISGVYLAGADIASAFQPIIPVWTAIIGLFVCVEKVISPIYLHMWIKAIGVLLAVGGAIEITLIGSDLVGSSNSSSASGTNSSSDSTHIDINFVLGCFSLLGNTVCLTLYILMQKKLIFNRPNFKWRDYPVAVTAWSYFFGAILIGLATLYVIPLKQTNDYLLPDESVPALVYAIFVTSALCYLLITWTTMHLSALIVTTFVPVQVLTTVVMSYFVIGEEMLPLQYVGAVMLLMGLGLVLFSNHLDERLAAGKWVIRLDCCCKKAKAVTIGYDEDEHKPLLASGKSHQIATDEV